MTIIEKGLTCELHVIVDADEYDVDRCEEERCMGSDLFIAIGTP